MHEPFKNFFSKQVISSMEVTGGGIGGWAIMPITHYVGLRGLEHFDTSMNFSREITQRISAAPWRDLRE